MNKASDLSVPVDVWELYGLKSNPFDTNPILVRGGHVPIDSFVGRIDNTRTLNKIIGSNSSSRILVYGDVGVGKTSFVNVVRYNAYSNGYFTPFREIAVQKEWMCEDFIYNTLSAIYVTLKLLRDKPIDNELYKKLESFLEIGMNDKQIGVEVLSVGGSYGTQSKNPTKLTTITVMHFFNDIIQNIHNHTNRSIIIHYNNLELLPEKKITTLFDDLRDFFQTDNIHFIFVGNLTVQSTIMSMPRVSSILNDTLINIEPLSFQEVLDILSKRLAALKIKDETIDLIVPYTNNAVKELYTIFDGNIRDILNSLNSAILEISIDRPIVLDENKLTATLNVILNKSYFRNITERRKDVLMEVVKRKEVTNKTISDVLKIPAQNVSKYLKDLEERGCISVRRKDRKNKFWTANPKLKWALLRSNNQLQKTIFDDSYIHNT